MLLAVIEPSSTHYRMTYFPIWTKRKGKPSWYLCTITPLLLWHSHLLWLTLWACAHFHSQSDVISPKISPKHWHILLVEGQVSDMSDLKLSHQAVGGQRAEQLQTPPAVWTLAAAKYWGHECTVQRKSAHFIRKKAAAEWPVIKAVIESSGIFKNWWQWRGLIACIHYLHLISCSLFPTKSHISKISIARKTLFYSRFICKIHPSKSLSGAEEEKSIPSCDRYAADLQYLLYCYWNYCDSQCSHDQWYAI